MKTFFTVKFALLPIAIFVFLIVRGMPAAAIGAGFAVALIVCAWRLYARDINTLEIAALAIFSALAAGTFLAPEVVDPNAVPLAFSGLGLFSIATVLMGKPWTGRVFQSCLCRCGRESDFRAGQFDPLRALGRALPVACTRARVASRRHRRHGHRGRRGRGVHPRAGIPRAYGAGAANAPA